MNIRVEDILEDVVIQTFYDKWDVPHAPPKLSIIFSNRVPHYMRSCIVQECNLNSFIGLKLNEQTRFKIKWTIEKKIQEDIIRGLYAINEDNEFCYAVGYVGYRD